MCPQSVPEVSSGRGGGGRYISYVFKLVTLHRTHYTVFIFLAGKGYVKSHFETKGCIRWKVLLWCFYQF
jgi:hypothetical protein